MRRREFISLMGGGAAATWAFAARAQQKIPQIGYMGNSTAALEANLINAFRDGLRDAGYEEGRNISIKYLWADGQYDRLPALVSELVAAKVDIIVTAGTPAALAVKQKTTTVPLVMVAVGDPVGTGLVQNLAHPGGNLTGLSSIAPDLEGKRLQLLREVAPTLSHVAMFFNSLNPFQIASVRQAVGAAQTLGIRGQARWALHPCGPNFSAQPQAYRGLCPGAAAAEHQRLRGTRRIRRPDVVRPELRGHAQTRRNLCRQNPQGYPARQSAN